MSLRRKDREILADILQELADTRVALERLDVAIITRYPDSGRAADEFAALRKTFMAGARAEVMHEKNLISLAESIEAGANVETVRLKMLDLLMNFGIRAIAPSQVSEMTGPEIALTFREVGVAASESPAWVRCDESGAVKEVVQMGRVSEFPAPADISMSPTSDADIAVEHADHETAESTASEHGLSEPVEAVGDHVVAERSAEKQDEEESK